MKNNSRGFTLIELLVVIALIGILAAVVLAALSTARMKGADANTRETLANTRAQGDLYYEAQNPNTYAGVCANTTPGIKSLVDSATLTADAGDITCDDSQQTAWALAAKLKTPGAGVYCVDDTGTSKANTTATGSADAIDPLTGLCK